MKLVSAKKPVSLPELKNMAHHSFGNMVKAVVDIRKKVMVVDAELHADQEAYLLKNGSHQSDLWGINIYPDEAKDKRIEFDSMINLRPANGNTSRNIKNKIIREKIVSIINRLINNETS